MSAIAGAVGVRCTPQSDTIAADGKDQWGLVPAANILTTDTQIIPARAGPLLCYLIFANTTAAMVSGIKLFLNGSQFTGAFAIPANGTAIFDGLDLKIKDENGSS